MPLFAPPLLLITDDRLLADRARRLLAHHALECRVLTRASDCAEAPHCRWLKDAPLNHAGRIQSLLGEAVEVLEQTRHAFRSRELGQLRKRLERALEELPPPDD